MKLRSALESPITSYSACMVFNLFCLSSAQESTIVPKSMFSLGSPLRIRSLTRMEQHEEQQTVSAAAFNNLDSQVPPPVTQALGSPTVVPSQEVLASHNQDRSTPSIQINVPPPMPQYEHQEVPPYEEEMVELKKKPKIRQKNLRGNIKGTDSLGSVHFNDLCIHPRFEFWLSSSSWTLKNMMEKAAYMPTSR